MTGNEKTGSVDLYRGLVRDLHLAVSKLEMYGKGHPVVQRNVGAAFDAFRKILDSKPSFSISVVDDGTLIVDDVPIKDDTFSGLLAADLLRKDVQSLVFNSTLTLENFEYIVDYFVRSEDIDDIDLEIREYLRAKNIRSVAANMIKYKRVADGEGVELSGKRAPSLHLKDELAPTAAQKILDELATMSPETVEYLSENGVLKTVSELLGKEGVHEGDRNIAALDTIVDRHMQRLGSVRGRELERWYKRLRGRFVENKAPKKPELSRRADFVVELDDYVRLASRGANPSEMRNRLKALLEATLSKPDIEEVENVYHFLLSTFVKTPSPGFLISTEVLVNVLFDKSDQGVVDNFAKNRFEEKFREKNSSFETEFSTTTLLWITAFYLSRNKLLPVLNIARLFDKRRKNKMLPDSLIEDAKTFFASLCVGFPLDSLVSAMGGGFFDVPPEIRELFAMIDSRHIAERVLKKMGAEDNAFAMRAAEALSVIPEKSAWVFANELWRVRDLPRDMSGQLLSDVQRRKESGAMLALSLIAGEKAIPVFTSLTRDRDPEIRFSALEAISHIGTEKAIRLLVKFIYSEGEDWRRDVARLIPHLDPKIAVPVLVRFFHSRRERWTDIIRIVGNMKGEQSRTFLVDTLFMWNSYTSGMNTYEAEEFVLTLLDAVEKCEPNAEVKRALRMFLSEWHNFDLLRGLKVVFSSRKDLVTEKVREILSKHF
ncbi:HEAT repeat domain-containing protein [bacterium]|nr:HEAT repeat domain-containing protein [bacterium]